MKWTKERKWYNFWVKSFNDKLLEEDKALLTTFYQNQGYRDFHIVQDTLIVDEEKNSLNLVITINEGEKYQYRNFTFEGNKIASIDELTILLGLKEGDDYSQEDFEKAVFENMMSVYNDKGYIFSYLNPEILPVGENLLDINFLFNEGKKYI